MSSNSDNSNNKNLNSNKNNNINKNNTITNNIITKKNNNLFEICKNFFLNRQYMPMFSIKNSIASSYYTFPIWLALLIIIGIIIII